MIVLIAGAYFGLVTVLLMSEIDVLFKLLLTMRISTEK